MCCFAVRFERFLSTPQEDSEDLDHLTVCSAHLNVDFSFSFTRLEISNTNPSGGGISFDCGSDSLLYKSK